jgi:hypothetical protein
MNVIGQVYIGNTLVTDGRDIVAAFDENNRCMGVNNIKYDPSTGRSMAFLTVYDSTTVATHLFFRLWHYATGKTMQLTTSEPINFAEQTIRGSVAKPIQMIADDLYLQKIELTEGWNWISFNVYNPAFEKVSTVLNAFPWQEGDIMTEDTEGMTLVYHKGKWKSNTSSSIDNFGLSQTVSYRIKVKNDQIIDIWGSSFRQPEDRIIKVGHNWNSIGYTPMVNLPVATALSDYFDEASDGDVIKNQHEFAMFVSDGAGGGEWLGTLEYMKPGNGYMLFRKKETDCTFSYPYYEPGATFIENNTTTLTTHHVPRSTQFATTMNVVAEVEGIDVLNGDKLEVYASGEKVGETSVASSLHTDNKSLFYLSIEGDVTVPLSFAVVRDDEVIAVTPEVMSYEANAISGTPSAPTKISFTPVSQLPQHGCYTLQGVKLDYRPTQAGVYIYNGQKQVIK